MEVREPGARYLQDPGLKPSDVGYIPGDWEATTIGGIAAVASGSTPSRKVPSYWGGEIPWVTTAQIDFNTVVDASESITDLGLKNSAAKLVAPGALLMALYGQGKTRGKVAILGIEAATNQACASIVVSSSISRQFVFHYLCSQYEAIRKLSNSGSQDNLSGKLVRSINIPLPSRRVEQDAIAEALSDADALIESLEQLLAKKRQIKQGAMQELLTGQRTLGWPTAKLGELFWFQNGVNADRTAYGRGVLFANVLEVISHNSLTSERIPGRVDLPARVIESFAVALGDVLFNRTSETQEEVGLASVFMGGEPTVFGGFVIRGRPHNDRLLPAFAAYALRAPSVRTQIVARGQGAVRANIGQAELAAVTIALPTRDEQTAIAQVLSDMDAELSALEARLTKARQLKQGMAQALLTGRIRLV